MKKIKLIHHHKVSQYVIPFLPAVLIWLVWSGALGPEQAFSAVLANWEISLTMVFGSLVAGATSMGGGVVAFPIFTKLLAIPPYDAKVFSLAIQTVGMGAATIVIYLRGIRVDWRIIRWGSLGGAIGIFLGLSDGFQLLPPPVLKLSFTLMLTCFAIALFVLNRRRRDPCVMAPIWNNQERIIVMLVGACGGVLSGLVGTGIDIFLFIIMVLLFRMCEKTATPTSVILMAFNALCGFILQIWFFQDFSPVVQGYWYAAIPVVVVGAPLGAILCSWLTRQSIVRILIGLITIELLTTLLLVPLTPNLIYAGIGIVLIFSYINYRLLKVKYYEPDVGMKW
ncbi:MAG: sulfite exporter TauE/SafE family protein [Pseudomonadota bacterium]